MHDWIVDDSGQQLYANRAVLMARARLGKLVEQEDDDEDTERVVAYEALVDGRGG